MENINGKTILAIGAHVGDMELTAGALLASCAVSGGRAVTLALTAGEKGAPPGRTSSNTEKTKSPRPSASRPCSEVKPSCSIIRTACCRQR